MPREVSLRHRIADAFTFWCDCSLPESEPGAAARAKAEKAEKARQIELQEQDMEFASLKKALGELG